MGRHDKDKPDKTPARHIDRIVLHVHNNLDNELVVGFDRGALLSLGRWTPEQQAERQAVEKAVMAVWRELQT